MFSRKCEVNLDPADESFRKDGKGWIGDDLVDSPFPPSPSRGLRNEMYVDIVGTRETIICKAEQENDTVKRLRPSLNSLT